MRKVLEEHIERLTRMMGSDEGFYILALHSFVEYFLRYDKAYGHELSFPELTWRFREELLAEYGDEFIDGLSCLARLGKQHSHTNRVRHAFEKMDVEEANAATHLFLTFCRLAGIDRIPALGSLQKHLDLWKDRSSPLEKSVVIRHMQRELEKLRRENSSLLEQKKEFDELSAKLAGLQRRLADYDEKIQEKERLADRRDQKLNELRVQRHDLAKEKNTLLEKLSHFEKLQTYLQYLGRLSVYTRTRMDFEQSISRLTPEQEAAVRAVQFKRHFLIRGGAGTGKSLVLIESLKRAVLQRELDFKEDEQAVLVTFTRTLAKYNRYIAEIKHLDIPLEVIDTVDRIFIKYLESFVPGISLEFEFMSEYFKEGEIPSFISGEELAAELEEFIFAFGLTRSEYVDGEVSRKGMRKRLSKTQREEIWNTAVETSRVMRERKTYTKNFGRLALLRRLQKRGNDVLTGLEPLEEEKEPAVSNFSKIRCLFLDEVQDLSPVAIAALRELTSGPMIMAGDMAQSLYVYYSPFVRAGIDIRGSVKVLKTNFRNTRQIHELAERFRRQSGNDTNEETIDEKSDVEVFREGPAPELYTAYSPEVLLSKLVERTALYIEELRYDPENLCIFAPRRNDLTPIQAALESSGIAGEDMRAQSFSFRSAGTVRVSTLHSGKGLDFPVVLLYLPSLHRRKQFGERETERLLSNLVYVGITRAMDSLDVFISHNDDPILTRLKNLF
jgi:hypothetical protein